MFYRLRSDRYPERIDWYPFCTNLNANVISLLEANQDNINWRVLLINHNILLWLWLLEETDGHSSRLIDTSFITDGFQKQKRRFFSGKFNWKCRDVTQHFYLLWTRFLKQNSIWWLLSQIIFVGKRKCGRLVQFLKPSFPSLEMDKRTVVFAQTDSPDRILSDFKVRDDRFSIKKNSRMTTSDSDDERECGGQGEHDDITLDSPYSTDSNNSNDLDYRSYDISRMITSDTAGDQNILFTTSRTVKKTRRTFLQSVMQALYMVYHNWYNLSIFSSDNDYFLLFLAPNILPELFLSKSLRRDLHS